MKNHISKSLAAIFFSLISLNPNVSGMEANNKDQKNRVSPVRMRSGEFDYDKSVGDKTNVNSKYSDIMSKTSGQAIKYNGPMNILIIDGTDGIFRAQQLAALLCHNKFGLMLSQIEGTYDNYANNKVYELVGQPNVRVLFYNVKDFNSENFKNGHNPEFIAKNANIILYLIGNRKDKKIFETLKKFYHTFNYWWCKGDYDYKGDYKSYGDSKDNWFRYVLNKRKINTVNHRYMHFLYFGSDDERDDFVKCHCKNLEENGHEEECNELVRDFISGMPDGRSIAGGVFYENCNINALVDMLFGDGYGSSFVSVPYDEKKIISNYVLISGGTSGTGTEKKKREFPLGILMMGIAAAIIIPTVVVIANKLCKKNINKNGSIQNGI